MIQQMFSIDSITYMSTSIQQRKSGQSLVVLNSNGSLKHTTRTYQDTHTLMTFLRYGRLDEFACVALQLRKLLPLS